MLFFTASNIITWLDFFNLIGQDGIPSWQIKLLQECSDDLPQEGRLADLWDYV